MAKTLTTLAGVLLTASIGVATGQNAFAQLKEGCGVEITEADRAAMQGSEDGSTSPEPGVGGPKPGAEEHAAMEGSVGGSNAPMPGRGECDEIDTLPQAETEG